MKPDRNIPIQTLKICAVTAITQDDHRSQLELGPPVDFPEDKAENFRNEIIERIIDSLFSKSYGGKTYPLDEPLRHNF